MGLLMSREARLVTKNSVETGKRPKCNLVLVGTIRLRFATTNRRRENEGQKHLVRCVEL
jgi:hypothetical protein